MSMLDSVDLYELHSCMHALVFLCFLATCFANLFSSVPLRIHGGDMLSITHCVATMFRNYQLKVWTTLFQSFVSWNMRVGVVDPGVVGEGRGEEIPTAIHLNTLLLSMSYVI